MEKPIKPKQKLLRVLGTTGWSRHHTADLLGVTTFSLGRYLGGLRKPPVRVMERLDYLYEAIVLPLECQITELKNEAEKHLLKSRIKTLVPPPHCE